MALLFVPAVEMPPNLLAEIFESRVGPMRDLMDDDQLFLLDVVNVWGNSHRNVFKPQKATDEVEEIFKTVDERRGDRAMFSLINVESQLPTMDGEQLRRMRFWEEENLYREDDTTIYFYNLQKPPLTEDC